MRPRAGVTLIELIVVIAIIGMSAGVTALALRRAAPVRGIDMARATVAAARDSALRSGRAVTVSIRLPVQTGTTLAFATARPDGRVLADSALAIDPLTGKESYADR